MLQVKLGEWLLKEDHLTPQQLQSALVYQRNHGGSFGRALLALGLVTDEHLTSLLSRFYNVPSTDLGARELDPAVVSLIPPHTVRQYRVLPLARDASRKTLSLAMAQPGNLKAIDDIGFMTGHKIEPVVVSEASLEQAIEHYYPPVQRPEPPSPAGLRHDRASNSFLFANPDLTAEDMRWAPGLAEIDLDALHDIEDGGVTESEDREIDLSRTAIPGNSAVVKLVNVMLVDSLKRRASAIHVEPYEKEFRIRFRIDDVLYNVMALPMKVRDLLTTRLKLMAKLDVTEKRLPQQGRIKIVMKVEDRSREFFYRITTWPTQWGEMIVMRLQDPAQRILDMTRLGFEPHTLERFKNAIARPSGIVLVTGPRRSGKTNTLYSALASLNRPDINIMTAEDPPDLSLPGINQLPLKAHLGLKAATVLQMLRGADADVILASEITDPEAARAALSLAQHGHLVLSTLPTSDTPSTVTYLLSMGIEPFLVATTVNLILAQRLVRRICESCKVDVTADIPLKVLCDIGFAIELVGTFPLYRGTGCPDCHGTGYKGRVGLFEALEVSDCVRDLILVRATTEEIKRKALEEGMLTLRMSGLDKIRLGVTTIDEVLRDTTL